MKVSDRKKKAGSVAVTSILLLGVGAGYAYWTSEGTSTGEAETGTAAAVTAVQTSVVTGLGPGVAPQPLAGTFLNAGDATVRVTTVAATLGGVTKDGAPVVGCDASDYELSGFPITLATPQFVTAGAENGSWSGGAIAFFDKATNQDACKGATVAITYTVS